MPGRLRNQAISAAFLMVALAAGHAAVSSEKEPAEPAGGEVDEAVLEQGRAIFTAEAVPQCGICHTLADAGTTGEIGPNLDELTLTADQVQLAVEGGVGVMPAYGDLLTEEEIDVLATYVAAVAGEM